MPLLSPAVRDEMRLNLRLAWPIIAAQLSFASMGTVDTLFAGRFSAEALAAVAVGANVFFMLFVLFMGLFMAVSPIVAQRWGAGRPLGEIGGVLGSALLLALVLGLGWTLLTLALVNPVLDLLALDAPTRAGASGYLRAIAWSGVPFCLSFVLRNGAEGLGLTRVPLWAGLVGLVGNILGDYALMYGHWGAPRLGPAGAGWATVIAAGLMVLTYAACYRRVPQLAALRPLARAPQRRADLATLLRLGLPIAAILTAEAWLFLAGALLMARFGGEIIAAHQIAINFASLTFMVPLSIGMATTVRVGHAAGAGDHAGAALRGRVGMLLGGVFALLSASLMLGAPAWIVHLYTDVPPVAAVAVGFLAYAAVFQLFDCVQATANGALRGLHDTRIPMLITLAAYWGVGMPLAVWLAFHTTVGPPGIWWGFIAGLGVAALGLASRFVRKAPWQFASVAAI